jgi:non-canonical (house-cleaning) NTP pyrophosphatase
MNRVDNLVKYAKENNISADLFMAIESGMTSELGFWAITNIAVIKNSKGEVGVGSSASFPVPNKYIEDIKQKGFGPVVDSILNTDNIRNSVGGINYLTHEKISRIDLTKEAFSMALTPFINGEIWKD